MPRSASLILDVPAHLQLIESGSVGFEQLLEQVGGVVGAPGRATGCEAHRGRTAALRRLVGDQRHAAGVLVVVVTRRYCRHRACFEVFVPDHIRICAYSLIAGVAVGQTAARRLVHVRAGCEPQRGSQEDPTAVCVCHEAMFTSGLARMTVTSLTHRWATGDGAPRASVM